MNLWRRTASILILLSECLLVSLGSTDNPIFISFVDTSAEVLSGVPFGLTLEATQEVTVTVGVSVCLEDVMLTIGGTMTTSATVSFTASSSEVISNIIATPMPPTAKSRVVDFYITDITPSDGVKVGETSWLRYIINTNEWTPFFPNDIYPDGSNGAVLEGIASGSFEFFIFLESPRESTATPTQVDVNIDINNGASTSTTMCPVAVSESFVECSVDLSAITSQVPVTLTLETASGQLVLPSSSLMKQDAHYSIFPATGQADGSIVHFSNGLKVVSEDVNEVTITIVTQDGFSADGTIDLEVFPENPNSYIVSPTTVDITNGAPAATVTVTVIDDSIDEGQYESFRIKIACINNGGGNTESDFARDEGLLFVIVDDDIAEVNPEKTQVCVTEGDECYDVNLAFNSPAAVSQRGEYRVCDNSGMLLTDDRDMVYSCSYDIPEHSCKTSLCFCTFDDWVPEATETFYIFPIPPEVSSAAGQVLTVTIEDDDPSNEPSASITDVTSSAAGLDEDSGTTELVITASASISGLFELKALYGTAELGVDYTISGVTFSSETMATVTLTIIQDDVYEEEECVTLFPSTSPVELGSNVVPVEICWDDTDEGIGLYPENAVGYIGCQVDFVVFSKTYKGSDSITLCKCIFELQMIGKKITIFRQMQSFQPLHVTHSDVHIS